jgi:hypothetical protein
VKSIILPLVESPRAAKQTFLVILDFCIFPVLIWLCYAIRQFDLGAEVVPNIPFGTVWVSAIAVLALFVCGVYRFIVRTFNEFFIVKLGLGHCSGSHWFVFACVCHTCIHSYFYSFDVWLHDVCLGLV